MQGGIGLLGLVAIIVVVAAAAVLAVLYFRYGMFRRRRARRGGKSGLLGESRIEVLERTKVDAERQLLLVRCDRVEHLILVGGPADVVVENDVKKVRGPGAPAPKTPVSEAGQSAAASLLATGGAVASRTAPGAGAAERRASTGARPGSAAIPPAAGRAMSPTSAGATHSAEPREQRPRTGEAAFGRQEPRPQPRRTIQPTPLGGSRPEPGRETATASRGNGRQEDAPVLPAAGVPWAEPDSIESEIVRALRVDPVARGGDGAPKAATASKGVIDPSTTLGDLADKLEEALAEEVQSASYSRAKPDFDPSTFAFDSQAGGGTDKRGGSSDQKSGRPVKKDAPQPALDASGHLPEPDRRRESSKAGERREEAPVISLSSRRREAADPLEDEMARLLGELTGDTKGR
jgi:hypothetical protein